MSEQSEKPSVEERKKAIQAYYDAKTSAEKSELVTLYPFLDAIFSSGNHS